MCSGWSTVQRGRQDALECSPTDEASVGLPRVVENANVDSSTRGWDDCGSFNCGRSPEEMCRLGAPSGAAEGARDPTGLTSHHTAGPRRAGQGKRARHGWQAAVARGHGGRMQQAASSRARRPGTAPGPWRGGCDGQARWWLDRMPHEAVRPRRRAAVSWLATATASCCAGECGRPCAWAGETRGRGAT
ncbi:uncharacterized protein [Zea mays]|jgi:hypothetical protein|uniref:Uncharacterized protein n=1 Tax=Zea mays TaxID=4577 RepID=C4J221_MAIZE|nr:uncharacterized protein LOC118473079 [Zea mays]ACR35221.1 unknown [Zea mays]